MHRSPPNRALPQHGAVLIPILFFMMLIAGLSMSLLIEVEGSVTAVKHKETSMMALEIAEMGVVQAELEIRGNRDAGTDGVGTVSGSFAGGRYDVTAVQDPALDGRWLITAVGTHGHSVRRIEVGVRRRTKNNRVEGLYAEEALTFGGNSLTDAYDSRTGTYTSQATNTDGGGTYALGGGHVGSGKGISVLGSSAHVRGNAIPGAGFATEVSGGATIQGDTMPRMSSIDLEPTPYADFLAAYSSNQNGTITAAKSDKKTPEAVADVSDTVLAGMSDMEVEALKSADTLLLTDAELLTTSDAELLSATYDSAFSVTTISLDTSLSAETTTTETTTTSSPGGGPSGGGGGPPPEDEGRLSYESTSYELRLTKKSVAVLDGGTYFFSDLRTVGRAQLIIRGPCKIYVTGTLDLGGGTIVNETGKAENLQIFVHPYALPPSAPPSTSLVKVRGGSTIAASIYAPEVDVTIGGGDDFYGAVVGSNVHILGNVRYHYDKALGNLNENSGATLERLFWRELNAPRR